MAVIAFLLALVFCLSSCNSNQSALSQQPQEVSVYSTNHTPVYEVYIEEENNNHAPLEPYSGCILGAHILSDKNINDISSFETLTQKKHTSYLFHMRMGEPFPLTWVLECMTAKKIPQIVLYPPNSYYPYDASYLEDAAEQFGTLNIPILLQFYPSPEQYSTDAEDYISFFQKARTIFREKAPNVSFVWSVDSNHIYTAKKSYPKDEYVDWVGINIYINEKENDLKELWNAVDYFYYSFQKTKPIMISQLAVSHYSSSNYRYNENGAAQNIIEIYSKIKESYPRIKAVTYIDRNAVENAPKQTIRNNYQITDNKIVLEAYRKAVNDSYFTPNYEENKKELYKSPFPAYEIDGIVYISEKTMLYDLKQSIDTEKIKINGENYIDSNAIPYTIEKLENNKIKISK